MFFTHARETISYHYERDPADPRIEHALTLEVDAYGNVLKSLADRLRPPSRLAAARRSADRDRQTTTLITYTENAFTNAVDEPTTTTARRCRPRRGPTS